MRKAVFFAALAVSAAPLAACSTAIEAVKGPELAPIGYPAALVPVSQAYLPASAVRSEASPASANSLWRTGARSFFGDQRARHIGDILTVRIDIDDRAQTQNSTQRQRSNDASAGVSNFIPDPPRCVVLPFWPAPPPATRRPACGAAAAV